MNELQTWENLIEAFRLHRDDLYTFIYYRSFRSKDLAEDIVQETFERAWVKREQFKNGSLRNWLYQIAINILRDTAKRESRNTILDLTNETIFYSDTNEEDVYKDHILRSLEKLKREERELIILFYILGYTHKEIGGILKKREGSVRVSVNRALNKLKDISNG